MSKLSNDVLFYIFVLIKSGILFGWIVSGWNRYRKLKTMCFHKTFVNKTGFDNKCKKRLKVLSEFCTAGRQMATQFIILKKSSGAFREMSERQSLAFFALLSLKKLLHVKTFLFVVGNGDRKLFKTRHGYKQLKLIYS